MLLDDQNSQYSSYTHPAYYNYVEHFAVDSSGTPSNGWMLTAYSSPDSGTTSPDSGTTSPDSGYSSPDGDTASPDSGSLVLYNTSTHEMVTPAEIAAGGTSWMLLDDQNPQYSSYTHPAYYNLSSHFVVDASGAPSNGWMLTAYSSPDSCLLYTSPSPRD